VEHPDLVVGLVEARGLQVSPSPPALLEELEAVVARRAQEPPPQEVKAAIRDLLRWGGYKPSGRNKPASEYLLKVAARGDFPQINVLVDINNWFSLETGLPMSVLDLDLAGQGAQGLEMRLGEPGEGYVFNQAGQEIDLKGLLCVARQGGVALGNPVKDAMLAKTNEETKSVLAVIYAHADVMEEGRLLQVARRYADALCEYAGALHARAWTLRAQ
jgi:DNA/RNA-binding domain of Phe-tRNA-synthetase-like protein